MKNIKNIKIYKFNECDIVATKENLKDTIYWYENIYDDDKINENDVEVIDIENTKIWYQATDEDFKKCQEDGLKNFYGDWYIKLTIREALMREPEYVSPYVLASSEV